MKILTERLILRELSKKDLEELFEAMNNIRISGGLIGVPHPYPRSEARWWINHALYERRRRPRTEYILAISEKRGGKMIGEIILSEVERDHKKAKLVYWLSEVYWRQGFATEAVKAAMYLAFTRLHLRRLEISAFAENQASNRLAKSLGFTYEGTQRKGVYAESTGKVHDDNFYSMLDSEYVERYGKRSRTR